MRSPLHLYELQQRGGEDLEDLPLDCVSYELFRKASRVNYHGVLNQSVWLVLLFSLRPDRVELDTPLVIPASLIAPEG